MVFQGDFPRFRIMLELEPVGVHRHADARVAAQRVADAIEHLPSEVSGLEDTQLVEVKAMRVERIEPND
jgi:hypothetical protein